jgi:hypothetical protein
MVRINRYIKGSYFGKIPKTTPEKFVPYKIPYMQNLYALNGNKNTSHVRKKSNIVFPNEKKVIIISYLLSLLFFLKK